MSNAGSTGASFRRKKMRMPPKLAPWTSPALERDRSKSPIVLQDVQHIQETAIYTHSSSNYKSLRTRIDVDRIQTWRETCSALHGDCCNDRYSAQLLKHISLIHLIDIRSGSLVTLPSTTPFIALSYVWGDVPILKTTKSNIESLREEGAIFKEDFKELLPQTIRDAIYLVDKLGERYLWVDCLCVVQDAEAAEMDRTLRAMAYIYASAEVTIAAACGDNANYGLNGISLDRNSKISRYRPWDLVDNQGYPDTVWAHRGWTFEESLFARRLLIVGEVVSWLCGRLVQHECFEDLQPELIQLPDGTEKALWATERPHLGVPMGMMSLIPDLPSLGRWGMLVQDYTMRTLTYGHDAIRAFAGATEIMGSTFPGGIVHGLPIFFFDIAMLWQPENSGAVHRPGQPSWSWTGWKGSVECWVRWYPHFAGLYRTSGSSSDYMTMAPLKPVAGYQLVSLDGTLSPHNDAFNGFYKYQAYRTKHDLPLPAGWERHDHFEGHFYNRAGTYRASHRYGFPLPSVNDFPSSVPAEISPVLLCTAPYVELEFGDYKDGSSSSVAGLIELQVYNSDYTVASLSLARSCCYKAHMGSKFQLIAISEAEVLDPEGLFNWFYVRLGQCVASGIPRCISDGEPFYNVIWIDWVGDVAYRKALGMMSKKEFETLGAELRTIKLG